MPDLDDTDLRLHEAVCPCHNLAFNSHLGACPITADADKLPKDLRA